MLRSIIAAVLLAGCAGAATRVVSSGPRSVIVQAGETRANEAQAAAEQECLKYGLHARLIGRPTDVPQFVFDCVP